MILMFIFLGLSVVLVIVTAIYLSQKKRGTKTNLTTNFEGKEKTKSKSKKQLADVFNIQIKDNIIKAGNRYSYIIKLGNIDYNMLSETEQNSIESILIQTALAIDYPIQFFSTTEYIDTSNVTSFMKENKTQNEKVQEYKNYLIDYLDNLMENKTIAVVKNYAVLSYDGLYENAIQELDRRASSFKGNLLKSGIICETLTEDEICNLIYRELNKNSSLGISDMKEGGKNIYVGKTRKEETN